MALMSRKVDYALVILAYLHHRPERGCAREIAERFELSRAFVANILKELCHKGFVISHRGVKGGYVLRRPAEDVSLADVMEALDDSFHLATCNRTAADEVCTLLSCCPVRDAVAEVHRRIRTVLSDVTLADLCRPACPCDEERLKLDVLPRVSASRGR